MFDPDDPNPAPAAPLAPVGSVDPGVAQAAALSRINLDSRFPGTAGEVVAPVCHAPDPSPPQVFPHGLRVDLAHISAQTSLQYLGGRQRMLPPDYDTGAL